MYPAIVEGKERQTGIALGALIAIKIVLLFIFAWHIRFVMDEFGQLGYAKYLGHGLFSTVQPTKAVGFAIFFKLAHLVGWDATSILLAGRIQTATLACATIAMVYGCARALGEDRLRALLIVLVLMCFSNFLEQIFRTRAEPLAVFFAVAALLVVLRGNADKARDVLIAGVLSGLAFLATQKSVYFNLAMGLSLVADAAIARRYLAGGRRGAWLVAGWALPIIAYCFVFGGSEPLAVAKSLVFGPAEVATRDAAEYDGLRRFVIQTFQRNMVLYAFCLAGMAMELARIGQLDGRRRIALIFTVIITLLVFAHNQPWPYIFVMALPFIALWALPLLDRLADKARWLALAWGALAIAITLSYVKNILYLPHDNGAQLELVVRAQSLLGPDETYFDGIGMLPDRQEPSTLWLDRHFVRATLREGRNSEAYQVLVNSSPKLILWSYRMDYIEPVIASVLRESYVRVAPNIRMVGHRLQRGTKAVFDVLVPGTYRLYTETGEPLDLRVEIDGKLVGTPFRLTAGPKTVSLPDGPAQALLLPQGSYNGRLADGSDDKTLFFGVYR